MPALRPGDRPRRPGVPAARATCPRGSPTPAAGRAARAGRPAADGPLHPGQPALAYRRAVRQAAGAVRAARSTSCTSSAAAPATPCCASSPPTPAACRWSPGPVEATALGNVLVQARALGAVPATWPGCAPCSGAPSRCAASNRAAPPPRGTDAEQRLGAARLHGGTRASAGRGAHGGGAADDERRGRTRTVARLRGQPGLPPRVILERRRRPPLRARARRAAAAPTTAAPPPPAANSMSSYPTTAMSSGTRSPWAVSPARTPSATRSLAAKTAVGRWASGRRPAPRPPHRPAAVVSAGVEIGEQRRPVAGLHGLLGRPARRSRTCLSVEGPPTKATRRWPRSSRCADGRASHRPRRRR